MLRRTVLLRSFVFCIVSLSRIFSCCCDVIYCDHVCNKQFTYLLTYTILRISSLVYGNYSNVLCMTTTHKEQRNFNEVLYSI